MHRVSLSETQRFLLQTTTSSDTAATRSLTHASVLLKADELLTMQCLDRRLPDRVTLVGDVAAWEDARSALGASVTWRFSSGTARIKLRHLYPVHAQ